MKNRVGEMLVLLGLVLAGVLCRVYFRGIPNFMPVAGMALFAGYFFRSRWQAVLVPFAVMGISDLSLSGYQWQMRLVVYGALLLPVVFGELLRRTFRVLSQQNGLSLLRTATSLIACSLASSILFFLLTNFAWWPWSSMYDKNLAGLLHCYSAGLPFFKYTLAGDLFFSSILFSSYAWALYAGLLPGEETTENLVAVKVSAR